MSYPDKKTFYNRNIKLFYLVEFFSSLFFLIPIWVAFELRYLSLSQLTIVEIIIFASQLILELPTGAFADLLGKKPTVFLGMMVTAVSFIFFGLADSYTDFIVSACLIGLGASLTSGAREALLFDTLKQVGKEKNFDKISSKLNMVFQTGMATATLVGGFLSLIHFRLPPIVSGITIFIAGILVLFMFEPKIDTEKFTLTNYIKQTKEGFKELFKTEYSSLISIFYGIVGGIMSPISIVFTKLLLVELSFSDAQMGIVFSIVRVINGVVLFLLLSKSKLLTRRRAFLLFSILIPFVLLPGVFFTKQIIMPFIFVMMFLSTARWVVLGKYTNQVFSSKNRATAISSLSMFVGIIYITVMLISGPIMERFDGSRSMFTLLGIISLFTITPIGLYIVKMHITEKKLKQSKATIPVLPETPAL